MYYDFGNIFALLLLYDSSSCLHKYTIKSNTYGISKATGVSSFIVRVGKLPVLGEVFIIFASSQNVGNCDRIIMYLNNYVYYTDLLLGSFLKFTLGTPSIPQIILKCSNFTSLIHHTF